ncbi:DUF2877 domain-containing protein [Aeromicrobium phragmitis]|uniref:DUF2877 domain-containing protein n=1 Tax=Aeromicrobium phragmitis TaxID=2478914 RepID=A0A3L8PLL2_9ACTN|nr:DUF2877 domain-containing protein [Aeromicrobium phragmitis]RLV56114.1 DUF2877 domain-containing protein [Aeromicrobium phragmitis]
MAARTAVFAAASPWVRDRFAESPRDGVVLHGGAQAVYVRVEDTVLAVVARGGVQVPCGAHTTLASLTGLDGTGTLPSAGAPVRLGDGSLSVGSADVRVARLIDARAPRFDATDASAMLARLRTVPLDPAVVGELPADALDGLRDGDPSALDHLLGLGSGLTPLGDDVTCGWLATMVAAAHPAAAPVSDRVLQIATARTTALSATLLHRSTEGDVLPNFARVLHQLRQPASPDEPAASVAALARIGHTSGTGLLLGLTLALDHLVSRSCP